MTMMMHDAQCMLSPACLQAVSNQLLFDILYADDTLLVGVNEKRVEELSSAIAVVGARYGMSLHWGKTQALTVGGTGCIRDPSGNAIHDTGTLQYLGAVLSGDGRLDSELSRKLGAATSDFKKLRAVWAHGNVTLQNKLLYFHSLVVSKLVYGLATCWLVTAQRRRVDGFYVRCLRNILRIPAAFVSRVSNATVLKKAGVPPFTTQLLQRQLLLLGKGAHSAADHPLRRDTFGDVGVVPLIGTFVRRVGRPRQDWTSQVLAAAQRIMGYSRCQLLLGDASPGAGKRWKAEVRKSFAT